MADMFSDSGAMFSECRLYRYRLWRYWDCTAPALCFVMLNPSTADEIDNDPTIERCQRRAMSAGYGGLEVVNLFAYRSTDPSMLLKVADPVGPQNDAAILAAVSGAGMVICAWGDDGAIRGRGTAVRARLVEEGVSLHALVLNKSGEPRHPLYVAYAALPFALV